MKPLLALCLAFAGCTAADRYRAPTVPDAPTITVLVPGYEGSFLYDGDQRVFVDARTALNNQAPALGTCEGPVELKPGGPVTRFSIWPYRLEVYGDFMLWGERELPGFTAFGYDWRADLHESADKLCAFVGDRRANIVAHSMGGLVAMLASEKCGDRFDAIVFAGVPFGGAPGSFYDLLKGEEIVRNQSLVPAQALWTFPSKWQMLPPRDDFFVDAAGRPLTVPISRPETWRHWKLACPRLLEARLADRASMAERPPPPKARVMAVIGQGHQTLAAIRFDQGQLDREHPVLSDGDGAVTTDSATPPFPATWVLTRRKHRMLLNDEGTRAVVRDFLVKGGGSAPHDRAPSTGARP